MRPYRKLARDKCPSTALDPAVVASGCSVGMQAAQNLVQEQLNRLVFNGVDNSCLSMRMELEVVDNDLNLRGDHVEDTPIGRLQLGDTIGTEFSADLRARLMQSAASRTKTPRQF